MGRRPARRKHRLRIEVDGNLSLQREYVIPDLRLLFLGCTRWSAFIGYSPTYPKTEAVRTSEFARGQHGVVEAPLLVAEAKAQGQAPSRVEARAAGDRSLRRVARAHIEILDRLELAAE